MNLNIIKLLLKLNFKALRYWNELKYLKKENKNSYQTVRKIAIDINKKLKIKTNIKGLENIENLSDNFFLVSNHRGMYDPILIASQVDKNLSFILKSSLQKSKLIDTVVTSTNSKYLERNPKDDLKTILEIIKLQKEGNNFLVFPEGTRNTSKELDFKAGCFKIPQKAKSDIIPIVLYNTEKVFDEKGPLEVYIEFLKPIKYKEYEKLSTVEINNLIQEKIKEKLKEF